MEAVEALAAEPRPPGSRKLTGALAGCWRIRVGSYRVVYEAYDKERSILVAKVGPRPTIYR